jgi:hypothetical protein
MRRSIFVGMHTNPADRALSIWLRKRLAKLLPCDMDNRERLWALVRDLEGGGVVLP